MLTVILYVMSVVVALATMVGEVYCKPWYLDSFAYTSFGKFLYGLKWWYFLPVLAVAIMLHIIGRVKYGKKRELPSRESEIVPMKYEGEKEPVTLFDNGESYIMYITQDNDAIKKFSASINRTTIIFGDKPMIRQHIYGATAGEKRIFLGYTWSSYTITIPEDAVIVRISAPPVKYHNSGSSGVDADLARSMGALAMTTAMTAAMTSTYRHR